MIPFPYSKRNALLLISKTDNRLSCVVLTLPPNTRGPPPHWNEMHEETYLTIKGLVQFHIPAKPGLDAKVGDYVVVPRKSPHTFSNSTDEAMLVCINTPAFYINYFKSLGVFIEGGGEDDPELNQKAMAYYATIPVPQP